MTAPCIRFARGRVVAGCGKPGSAGWLRTISCDTSTRRECAGVRVTFVSCADGFSVRMRMTATSLQPADKLKLAALVSIAVAAGVMGLKYLAYWRTGSAALYSDALESIVNLVTAGGCALRHPRRLPAGRPAPPVRPSQGGIFLGRHRRRADRCGGASDSARGLRRLRKAAHPQRSRGGHGPQRRGHRHQRRLVRLPDPLGTQRSARRPWSPTAGTC